MNARLPHADDAMRASSDIADGDDRRRTNDTDDSLTAEELALLASCGERIRSADLEKLRRTGRLKPEQQRPDAEAETPMQRLRGEVQRDR
jgi:hypothetical protein